MRRYFPPVQEWPTVYGPVCGNCDTADEVIWKGPAAELGTDIPVNLWECGDCCDEWYVPVTHWPVLEGPNCPVCQTSHTFWAAIAADHHGDLWMCEGDHEFVLTLEGLIVLPEDVS